MLKTIMARKVEHLSITTTKKKPWKLNTIKLNNRLWEKGCVKSETAVGAESGHILDHKVGKEKRITFVKLPEVGFT